MGTTPTESLWVDTSAVLPDDKDPTKFSRAKRARIVAAGIAIIANSALGSSLPSGATGAIAKAFSVTSSMQLVLLNSLYMLGFAVGPLVFGPLSEHIGRRLVLIGTYLGYVVFTLCCAVSPNFGALLIFRLLCGIFASAPNAVVGPLFADIFDNPGPRGKATAYYMCATSMVPPLGPILSGFTSSTSWRLTFWIGLAISGFFLPLVLCLPETYAPIIKTRLGGNQEALQKRPQGLMEELKVIFRRPFVMLLQEPVVLFTSLYLALVYAIFYLFFQAYPIIFQVSAGSVVALGLFLAYNSYHSLAMKRGAEWANKIEYRRLPLACAGGPLIIASLFWLGWSSRVDIHPAVPSMSGLIFGAGYLIEFMALLNYITDAYRQFSASAQAAASTTRSITAVVLPLAAPEIGHSTSTTFSMAIGFSPAPLDSSRLEITALPNPKTVPSADSPDLGNLKVSTDRMITATWTTKHGWANPRVVPFGPIALMPSASALQYATQCFEGMKLFRGYDGKLRLFRPLYNCQRMLKSATRISLPTFDPAELLKLIHRLCELEAPKWLPKDQPGSALYLRPTMIGSDSSLGFKVPDEAQLYIFMVYWPSPKPVVSNGSTTSLTGTRLLASSESAVRAWPGGTGAAKVGGNYGSALLEHSLAKNQGYDQVLWLYGPDRQITEAGSTNIFFTWRTVSGVLQMVTSPLDKDGLILAGNTRRSIIELATEMFSKTAQEKLQCEVVEKKVIMSEVQAASDKGRLLGAFVVGTAFWIQEVSEIRVKDETIKVRMGATKHVSLLRDALTDIMFGNKDSDWVDVVEEPQA
ncbi:branched-chain amino acid aminotransferase, cytosolic [Paramyrothecium foliicola]|nr:branched-chain amino acid aminotransferase, cytosolic [Paramyrothecium foliicola]